MAPQAYIHGFMIGSAWPECLTEEAIPMTLFIVLVVLLIAALFAAVVYGLIQGDRKKRKNEWRARRDDNPESWKMGSDGREMPR